MKSSHAQIRSVAAALLCAMACAGPAAAGTISEYTLLEFERGITGPDNVVSFTEADDVSTNFGIYPATVGLDDDDITTAGGGSLSLKSADARWMEGPNGPSILAYGVYFDEDPEYLSKAGTTVKATYALPDWNEMSPSAEYVDIGLIDFEAGTGPVALRLFAGNAAYTWNARFEAMGGTYVDTSHEGFSLGNTGDSVEMTFVITSGGQITPSIGTETLTAYQIDGTTWSHNLGSYFSAAFPESSAPEPSTTALALVGAAAAVLARRRRGRTP